jgi:hypothetical protein
METAPKKLSVSAILLGIIGGIIDLTGRVGNCGSARLEFFALPEHWKAGLRQFHRLEDKTIQLGAGLRLTLAGYLGICRSPRSK